MKLTTTQGLDKVSLKYLYDNKLELIIEVPLLVPGATSVKTKMYVQKRDCKDCAEAKCKK